MLKDRQIIVSELSNGGDLFGLVQYEGPLIKDEQRLKRLFREICMGVGAMHAHGYSHLDLKPENILLNLMKGV